MKAPYGQSAICIRSGISECMTGSSNEAFKQITSRDRQLPFDSDRMTLHRCGPGTVKSAIQIYRIIPSGHTGRLFKKLQAEEKKFRGFDPTALTATGHFVVSQFCLDCSGKLIGLVKEDRLQIPQPIDRYR